jgi:hypothetical protein
MPGEMHAEARTAVARDAATTEAPAPEDSAAAPSACPDCGDPIGEKICTVCGEKRFEAADYRLGSFLGEALLAVTDLEMPLARSFFALTLRPGLLTEEYLSGRRKRYLKPLQLFVLCNVIYFFALPFTGFNTLTTPLYVHMHLTPYGPLVSRMVEEKVARKGMTVDEYRESFDPVIQGQAKSLVILMVPLFALFLKALYRRRLAVGHLVFSLHFYSAFLLILILVNGGAHLIIRKAPRLAALINVVNIDVFFTSLFLSLTGLYIFLALRRVYAERRRTALLKTVALVLSLLLVVSTYRLVLFFTAFYAT